MDGTRRRNLNDRVMDDYFAFVLALQQWGIHYEEDQRIREWSNNEIFMVKSFYGIFAKAHLEKFLESHKRI